MLNGVKFAARNHQKYKNIKDVKILYDELQQDKTLRQDFDKLDRFAKTGNQKV